MAMDDMPAALCFRQVRIGTAPNRRHHGSIMHTPVVIIYTIYPVPHLTSPYEASIHPMLSQAASYNPLVYR